MALTHTECSENALTCTQRSVSGIKTKFEIFHIKLFLTFK